MSIGPSWPGAISAERFAAAEPFAAWVAALALPLRAQTERLEVSVLRSGNTVTLLLIGSPEPLPLGRDATLNLFRLADGRSTPVPSATVTADDTAAIVLALGPDGRPVPLAPAT